MNMQCPCGRKIEYNQCCGLYIEDDQIPLTPETLMRSRYTAYTQANIDYIKNTMQGPASKNFNEVSAKSWAESVEWVGLHVLNVSPIEEGIKGYVEFIALYKEKGKQHQIHEISKFRKINQRWYYVNGQNKEPSLNNSKLGRNGPCSCGSGKKYKHCCL